MELPVGTWCWCYDLVQQLHCLPFQTGLFTSYSLSSISMVWCWIRFLWCLTRFCCLLPIGRLPICGVDGAFVLLLFQSILNRFKILLILQVLEVFLEEEVLLQFWVLIDMLLLSAAVLSSGGCHWFTGMRIPLSWVPISPGVVDHVSTCVISGS